MGSNKDFVDLSYWLVEMDDGLSVIADVWLGPGDKTCLYPNTKQKSKIDRALEKKMLPTANWKIYNVLKVFGKYATPHEAALKIPTAEVTSDVNNEETTVSKQPSQIETPTYELPSTSSANRTRPARLHRSHTPAHRAPSSSSLSSMSVDDDDDIILPSPPSSLTRQEHNGRARNRNPTRVEQSATAVKTTDSLRVQRSAATVRPTDPVRVERSAATVIATDPIGVERGAATLKPTEGNARQNSCTHAHHLSEERLLRLEYDIRKMKMDIRRVTELVEELPGTLAIKKNRIVDISEVASFDDFFPLKTEEEVNKLETMLTADAKKAEYLEKFFKTIGGKSLQEAVRRSLVRTFTDNVATGYSWEGRRGKHKLVDLKILKVLYKALLATCTDIDEAKFHRRAADWFRQAGGRIKGSEKRNKNNVAENIAIVNIATENVQGPRNIEDENVAVGNNADIQGD